MLHRLILYMYTTVASPSDFQYYSVHTVLNHSGRGEGLIQVFWGRKRGLPSPSFCLSPIFLPVRFSLLSTCYLSPYLFLSSSLFLSPSPFCLSNFLPFLSVILLLIFSFLFSFPFVPLFLFSFLSLLPVIVLLISSFPLIFSSPPFSAFPVFSPF
jgi:hypothetical protein